MNPVRRAERYLFAPGSGRRLLVTQVALAGVIGLRIALGPYRDLARQPAALFRPVSFLGALDAMPGAGVIVGLQVVGTLAAALAIAGSVAGGRDVASGRLRRVAFPVAWLCLLVLAGLRSSRGKFLHNDVLLLLAAVPFLLAPAVRWRDRATAASSVRFGWPVRTALVVVAGAYFLSGLAKLTTSGVAWVTSDNMRNVLYEAAGGGKVAFPGVPTWLAGQAWLTHGLAAGVLAFELTFPVVLFLRHRAGARTCAAYAGAAVAFHAGTWLALGLDYWAWAAVAVIVLVDGRVIAERSSRYRLWRRPEGRAAAGNQRCAADVVITEPWPTGREKAEDSTCENAAAGADAQVSPRTSCFPSS